MLASTVSSKLLKSMAEVEGFQFQVNQTNCIVVPTNQYSIWGVMHYPFLYK